MKNRTLGLALTVATILGINSFAAQKHAAQAAVTMELLTKRGCVSSVLGALRAFSPTINFVDRKSGYIELRVAPSHVQDVLAAQGLTTGRTIPPAWMLNPTYTPQSKRRFGVSSFRVVWPRVATSLAPGHQFFPAGEIGLPALWKNEPDGDGRGVRIGLLDGGLDLLHPGLRFAKDAQGHIVPKLADISAAADPQQDVEWVETARFHSLHGFINADGVTWRIPHDGSYRFGLLNWRFDPELAEDKPYALHLVAGVLWDTAANVVWVDTSGNRDFTKYPALRDYAVAHQIAWFGKIDARGDERIPFAIKIDTPRRAIYVDLAFDDHGAWVAGTLAANRLSGGLFDGAAPMAQIVDIRAVSGEMLSFVAAFADPNIDVINCSCGIGRVGRGARDGTFQRLVLERLIQVYHKPLVCVCAVRGAISVDDYQSPEQLRRNRHTSPPYRETINGSTWVTWGPNPGGIENFLLAPSASLTTQSRYLPVDYPRPDGRIGPDWGMGVFDPPAPAGYAIGANNSPTITVVSGIVADLIGLARQHHIRYDAMRMSNALFTGSRIVASFPASVQENGLVNALGAWHQLVAMNHVDNPGNPELTHFDVLRDPDKSRIDGYFENIFKPSGDVTRQIWIVRRGGYAGSRVYRLSMRPDGIPGAPVFRPLRTTVELPRDIPVLVAFHIHPRAGDRLAYLQLIDARSGTVMQQIPLQVIVPEALRETASGVMMFHTEIAPRRTDIRYFVLPDDVMAVHVRIHIPSGGQSYPPGILNRRGVDNGAWEGIGSEAINAQPDPSAFWQVFWGNRGLPEYETQYEVSAPSVPIPATVIFEEYRVTVRRYENTLVFTNALAPFNGRIELFADSTNTHPVSGSETEYTLRKRGEQWTILLPSNIPLSGQFLWALRLAPLKSDSKRDGYLTKPVPIPTSYQAK